MPAPPSVVVLDDRWPADDDVRSVLEDVVAELQADPHAMVDAVLSGMYANVPSYAGLSEDEMRVVGQGVVHTVTTFIGLLGERRRLTPEEIDGIAAIGAVRASQGVPLDDMLAAIRVAMRWGWAHILDRASTRPAGAALTAAIGRLAAEVFDYMQQAASAMTRGVDLHERNGLRADLQARRDVVEELLSGAFRSDGELLARAAGHGVDLSVPYEVLVIGLSDAFDDRVEPLRDIKDAIVAAVPGALDGSLRASPTVHAVLLLPAAIEDGEAAGAHRAAVDAAAGGVAVTLATGPEQGPSALVAAYRRAATALAAARRVGQGPGIFHPRHFAAYVLLASAQPESARVFTDDVLGPILSLPDAARTRVVATLEAIIATNGTASEVADRLGIHPKTAVTRLRELERLTGHRAENPDERLVLELALLLHRLHSEDDGEGGGEGPPD
jgi:hypothetical protein